MELTLPTAPVALTPGVPTRVPVQVRNPYAQHLELTAYLARGRASGWATVEPRTLRLGPGESTEIGVVLEAPPHQPPSSSLVPFTVHVAESGSGEPAGFATALLSVVRPAPMTGDLVARDGRHRYDLRLVNDGGTALPLRIVAAVDPPAGSVEVRPDAVLLEPGTSVTLEVRARPRRPLTGTARPYAVVVKAQDAYDTDRAPYVSLVATGTRRPRLSPRTATVLAIVLALAATAAVALTGDRLPLPGRDRATRPSVAPAAVGRPYALVEVFPRDSAGDGRAEAEAARSRLAAAGMPVRLVDSLASDVVADGGAGFWVLLQDGFGSAADAEAYCVRWRPVAPKCAVTP